LLDDLAGLSLRCAKVGNGEAVIFDQQAKETQRTIHEETRKRAKREEKEGLFRVVSRLFVDRPRPLLSCKPVAEKPKRCA
jgi:hypothetical protein